MKYAFKNLLLLIRNETFIFISMVICILTSSWTMLFAYGIFYNFNAVKNYGDEAVWKITPEIYAEFTVGDFIKFVEAIPAETGNNVAIYSAEFLIDDWYVQGNIPTSVPFIIRVGVKDNTIVNSDYLIDVWEKNQMLKSGRLPTDEEQMAGANVATIAFEPANPDYWNAPCLQHKVGENKVELFGKEYDVIGTADIFDYISVPVKTLPPDISLDSFSIYLGVEDSDEDVSYRLSKKDFDNIKNTAEEILPGVFRFDDIHFSDDESIYIYNNVILISIFIAFLVIINFAAAYLFIIKRRQQQIAVMSICGASRHKLFRIYLGECCLITMPLFLIGTAAFVPFMKNVLSDIFPYMSDAFSPIIYLIITGIYFVMMLMIISIMLFSVLRNKTVEILNTNHR